jgi:aspartyl-tRNA(Asn)/glutamyl-tRNA(Gln) amidotransferase subunit B
MHTPEEAYAYLTELRGILTWVGVSDCKMEEGSLRCDANVSVRPRGTHELGTKVEVKNMNSFKSVQRAIAHEIERQGALLRDGGRVVQETRAWDEDKQITHSMRSKEQAHDYRYFPEPDLLPLTLSAEWVAGVRDSLPELPAARRRRFVEQYGIPAYDATVVGSDRETADYFEGVCARYPNAKEVSNWLMGDYRRLAVEGGKAPSGEDLADMLTLIDQGVISKKLAKSVLEEMFKTGDSPQVLVERHGWRQIKNDDHLQPIVAAVLDENPAVVRDVLGGKDTKFGFLVGQVMKKTGGKAAPADVNRLLRDLLASRST